MNTIIRTSFIAVLAYGALFVGASARADYVLQTATAGVDGAGDYAVYGDGTNANSNFVGAAFAVSGTPISALQVGANIDAYGAVSGGASGDGGNGQVFAEIVSLGSLSSLPAVPGTGGSSISVWLQANDLGHAILTVPSAAGDVSGIIGFSSALAAGNYALIFGSGLYGTTGGINLTSGNATIGTPNLFSSITGDSFTPYGYDSGIRLFAAPVPLPAGLPLLASGLLSMLGLCGKRRAAVEA